MKRHRVVIAALLLAGANALRAATFNIANGDTAAFRSAISVANTNGQANTINLAAGGMYLFTIGDGNDDALTWINSASGHLLTINGNGATVQRSTAAGTPDFRIFEISTDTTIFDLTIANGRATTSDFDDLNGGGAIVSDAANLTLTRCTLRNNYVYYFVQIHVPSGGGAVRHTGGTLTVQECLFDSNTVALNANDTMGQPRGTRAGGVRFQARGR